MRLSVALFLASLLLEDVSAAGGRGAGLLSLAKGGLSAFNKATPKITKGGSGGKELLHPQFVLPTLYLLSFNLSFQRANQSAAPATTAGGATITPKPTTVKGSTKTESDDNDNDNDTDTGSSSSSISTTTCASDDAQCNACAVAAATIRACSSAIPDFNSISDNDLAQCLCYDPDLKNSNSFIWVPQAFDVPFSGCPVYAKTADPSDSGLLSSALGFCSSAGNVLHVTSSDSATFPLSSLASAVTAAGSTNSGALATASSLILSGTKVVGAQTSATPASSGSTGAAHAVRAEATGVMVLGLGIGAGIVGLVAL
ncbi:hypothetical protein NA57DRAFT_55038 [Rhizodiscina lignyota]|uniref:Uncharacterized protein n=1 Tax=Rhizodiscina lignyota TaxID=1504668 RepID=A0A9P4IMQ9_9PEZI|nr:hypothetical protein NA57DRAFT_55038 [Rhizodiscina lignyota]